MIVIWPVGDEEAINGGTPSEMNVEVRPDDGSLVVELLQSTVSGTLTLIFTPNETQKILDSLNGKNPEWTPRLET